MPENRSTRIPGIVALNSVPVESATRLVLRDARLEEILFLLKVENFAHPRERVLGAGILLRKTNLVATTIGDVLEVLLEHIGI